MKSRLRGIFRAILQGSLLFNIVIHNLNAATTKIYLVMYAGDTTLISTLETSGNTVNSWELKAISITILFNITTWLHSYILKLNAPISKFMLFFKHPR